MCVLIVSILKLNIIRSKCHVSFQSMQVVLIMILRIESFKCHVSPAMDLVASEAYQGNSAMDLLPVTCRLLLVSCHFLCMCRTYDEGSVITLTIDRDSRMVTFEIDDRPPIILHNITTK